jgi:hypothetical protein
VGYVVDKAALGQAFFEFFGFPCQSFYRLLHTHQHSSPSGAIIIGNLVTSVIVARGIVVVKTESSNHDEVNDFSNLSHPFGRTRPWGLPDV